MQQCAVQMTCPAWCMAVFSPPTEERQLLPPPPTPHTRHSLFPALLLFTSCIRFMQDGTVRCKAYTNSIQGRQEGEGQQTHYPLLINGVWTQLISPLALRRGKPSRISHFFSNLAYLRLPGRSKREWGAAYDIMTLSFISCCRPATVKPFHHKQQERMESLTRTDVGAAVHKDTALWRALGANDWGRGVEVEGSMRMI